MFSPCIGIGVAYRNGEGLLAVPRIATPPDNGWRKLPQPHMWLVLANSRTNPRSRGTRKSCRAFDRVSKGSFSGKLFKSNAFARARCPPLRNHPRKIAAPEKRPGTLSNQRKIAGFRARRSEGRLESVIGGDRWSFSVNQGAGPIDDPRPGPPRDIYGGP
jgi:hypothetical protein